ncbi:CRISPR-associated endonuclease Cas2 [Pseudoalteromonas piscicida]|uniref:CRISPR-associated endonuclease Cas2 n=1 Tax=Pseudoalteromonas piscicida TaxID=43662 RepID=UPI001C96B516|nr:CRISPR-associated endonuclease Cas2 [Pseudoalteromonas piscicida]QZO14472.1 CRISPR-associated endonuclease Cas2 [Pseudoalteromonas piscicida]
MSLIYVVTFDIENDKLRRKIGNTLLEFGDRVQYSVFEIKLANETALVKLKQELQSLVDGYDGTANIRFYYLNHTTRTKSMDLEGKAVACFPSAQIF